MRRRTRMLFTDKAVPSPSTMDRDLDYLLDQWRESSPEMRQQLILDKIRHEERQHRKQTAGD